MNDNRTIHLVDIPIGGKSGYIWNRLHGEREEICESLVKTSGPFLEERHGQLQARLRNVDDALDRLMAGSYGNCSECGRAIDDAMLELDPALARCVDCGSSETRTPSEHEASDVDKPRLTSLEPFDTILLRTRTGDYRLSGARTALK